IASSPQGRTDLSQPDSTGLKLVPHPNAIQREPGDTSQRDHPPRPRTNGYETLHRTSLRSAYGESRVTSTVTAWLRPVNANAVVGISKPAKLPCTAAVVLSVYPCVRNTRSLRRSVCVPRWVALTPCMGRHRTLNGPRLPTRTRKSGNVARSQSR